MGRDRESSGVPAGGGADPDGYDGSLWGSALIRAVGTLDGAGRRGSTGPLRSWVIGWTHRFDARARNGTGTGTGTGTGVAEGFDHAVGDAGVRAAGDIGDSSGGIRAVGDVGVKAAPDAHSHAQSEGLLGPARTGSASFAGAAEQAPPPAVVRRLVEAVVDVLLERRSAEQVRRWVSREVFGLLSTVAQRRASIRFASRSTVRSIRMHIPALDAVESTVLVQDGPRVRAVALRFERSARPTAAHATCEPERCEPVRHDPDRLEWRCTALQFA
jgi:hypothetical protein